MQSVVLAKLAALALAVDGSGTIKEESRYVGDFSSVSVEQGISANISVGSKRSVAVSADDNLLPLVRTEVKDGRLKIGITDRNVKTSNPIRVNVTTPELTYVAASSGSSVTVEGTTGSTFQADGSGGAVLTVNKANAEEMKVAASGGGRVKVSGTAKDLKLYVSGGSSVKATDVPATSVSITGSGGAQAEVAVSESLEADVSGGAKVLVKGNPPKRNIHRNGGAEVRFEAS